MVRSLLSVVSAVSVLSVSACGSSAQSARVILPPGASFGAVTDSLKATAYNEPRLLKLMPAAGVDRSCCRCVQFPPGPHRTARMLGL